MKPLAWALACAMLVPAPAWAQTNTAIVQGTISDFSTKAHLGAVHVRAVSRSGSVSTTSDAKGFFNLFNVPLGPVTISFTRRGYVPLSGRMCIHPGMKRVVDVRLSTDPGSGAYAHWLRSRNSSGLMQTTNATTLANC